MCASSVRRKTSSPHLRMKTTPASQNLAPIHPSLPIIIPTYTKTQPAPPERKTAPPPSSESPQRRPPGRQLAPQLCLNISVSWSCLVQLLTSQLTLSLPLRLSGWRIGWCVSLLATRPSWSSSCCGLMGNRRSRSRVWTSTLHTACKSPQGWSVYSSSWWVLKNRKCTT